MSNIGTIALFVGVAIAGVIVWEIRRAPRVELAAARHSTAQSGATIALGDGSPSAE